MIGKTKEKQVVDQREVDVYMLATVELRMEAYDHFMTAMIELQEVERLAEELERTHLGAEQRGFKIDSFMRNSDTRLSENVTEFLEILLGLG